MALTSAGGVRLYAYKRRLGTVFWGSGKNQWRTWYGLHIRLFITKTIQQKSRQTDRQTHKHYNRYINITI